MKSFLTSIPKGIDGNERKEKDCKVPKIPHPAEARWELVGK